MLTQNDATFSVLAEQFVGKIRTQGCTAKKFAEENPEHRELILEKFPAIEWIESVARRKNLITDPVVKDIGNYILGSEIGRGGMGVVYEARHATLGSKLALKLVPISSFDESHVLERFQREAQICSQLNHPHIVPVSDFGVAGEYAYCAMQRIDGEDLTRIKQRVVSQRERGKQTDMRSWWTFVARIGIQAADALEHAHANGIIHRDIKPSNLILDQKDNIWITDFGVAKSLNQETKFTKTGGAVGTVWYMAPEQLRGDSGVASDIYGLGLTLSELVWAVCCPVDDEPDELTLVNGPHRWEHIECVPDSLKLLISKACDLDPKNRYQSASELRNVLQRFLDGNRAPDRRRQKRREKGPWLRKSRLLSASMLILFLGWGGYQSYLHCIQPENSLRPWLSGNDNSMIAILSEEPSSESVPNETQLVLERIETLLEQHPNLAYVPEAHKFYMFVSGAYTWQEAEERARDQSINSLNGCAGQLATIRSQEENAVAWALARKFKSDVLLGGSDQITEGRWHWYHQGKYSDRFRTSIVARLGLHHVEDYDNFAAGQPNDSKNGQDYLQMRSYDGKWVDVGGQEKSAYLVEWSESIVF